MNDPRNPDRSSDVDDLDVRGEPDPLPDGDDLLQPDLAAFREELRAFADRPAPAMSQDLARFVAGLGGLPEPAPEASRRKRPMILQHLSARLVAGGVAAVAMFSGLAVAGALPDGVQSAVSSAGDSVGVGLPHPDDGGPAREVLVASGASSSTPTTDSSSSSSSTSSSSTSSSSTSSSAPTSATTGPAAVTPASTPDSGTGATGVTGATSPATCASTPTTTPSSEDRADRDGDDGCDDTTSTSGPDTSGPSTSGPEAGDDHGGDRDRGDDDNRGSGSDNSGSGSGSSGSGSGSGGSGSGSDHD